jgi:hypothetical protein
MNEIKLNENDKELIFNTRLDCFADENAIFEFINNNIKTSKLKKNVFLVNQTDNLYGSDNVYIGDTNVMSELIYHFHKNLDLICSYYSRIKIPEVSVFYENNRLFEDNNYPVFEHINKYV